MTADKLIEKLQKFPKDFIVLMAVGGDFFEVEKVSSFEKGYIEILCGNYPDED